jgi:chemotaxis-related protein WspB
MLALMCNAAGNRFALDARQVLEVVPRVRLEAVAGSPAWLAGMCVYRGQILPVLDLAYLATGAACPNQWSSRIVLVQCTDHDSSQVFGLIVEQVAVTQLSADQYRASPASCVTPLGAMSLDDAGMFQLLDISRVLTAERRAALRSRNPERTDG